MKVNKHAQVKGKSQKWKDVRGKRHRPPVRSSDLNSSPGNMANVIKEHQVAVKKKPSVKRLKNKAKPVSEPKTITPHSGFKKLYAQANGSSVCALDNESDDFQDWKEYSQMILGNGVQTSGDMEDDVRPGRLEGEALHHCAQRDDRQNHAVLVMQKNQVRLSVLLSICSLAITQVFNLVFFSADFVFQRKMLSDLPVWPCGGDGFHH